MRQVEPIYVSLGAEIRRRRLKLGWSQARLGKALADRLTRASIAYIEAGQQRVLLHTLLALAEALRVQPADLFGVMRQERAPDPGRLAVELAEKLDMPATKAQSLAMRLQANRPISP